MKLLVSLCLLSLFAVSPALARTSSEPVEITKVFEKLNLSADQKAQLKVLRDEMQKKVESNKVAVGEAREKLDSVLDGESSDEAIRSAHTELMKQRNELETQQLEHMLKVRSLLTPEQRKTFSSSRPRGKNGNESRGVAPGRK